MFSDPFQRYVRSGIKPGLRRIRLLLKGMDNPERKFLSVVVAGSNGKGTTAASLHAILMAANLRAGLFTSPHLVTVCERFRIDHMQCSARALIDFERRFRTLCLDVGATYFEVTTACALWLFAKEKVDWAVLEIGLGGRWDACNVVNPELSIITSISKEHTEYLGTTLAKIAREKAQVARPERPSVVGRLPRAAERAMRSELGKIGALPCWLGSDFNIDAVRLSPTGTRATLSDGKGTLNIRTSLLGQNAILNSGLAATSFRLLCARGRVRMQGSISAAIQKGIRSVDWPARLQVVQSRPLTVLDVAHNESAILELVADWKRIWPGRKPWVVIGLLEGKLSPRIGKSLSDLTRNLVVTRPGSPRALDAVRLQRCFEPYFDDVRIETDVKRALKSAQKSAGARGAVLVCGSHYLVGTVLEEYESLQPDWPKLTLRR